MAEGTLRRSFGAQSSGTEGSLPAPASGVQAMVIGQITSLKTTMLESQANSNVLSELARPSPSRQVLAWWNLQSRDGLFVTAITEAEILFGPHDQPAAEMLDPLAHPDQA